MDSGASTDASEASRSDARADARDLDASVARRPDAARVSYERVVNIVCSAIARMSCNSFAPCGCRAISSDDPAICYREELAFCTSRYMGSSDVRRIAEGSLDVDLARLERCTARAAEGFLLCSGTMADFEELCAPAFLDRGARAFGDPCSLELFYCGDLCGLSFPQMLPRCAGGAGACSPSTGRCVPLPREGEACEATCEGDLVCVLGTCAPPGAEGTACEGDADCASGLSCAGGTCGRLVASGGACRVDGQCALGLRCVDGMCAADASEGNCLEGFVCASQERCAERPAGRCEAPAALGEACGSRYFDERACVAGLRCYGVCVPPLGSGEGPCSFDSTDCGPGLVCSGSGLEAACVPWAAAGDSCGPDNYVCEPGLGCVAGICGPASGDGGPCDVRNYCADGFVCSFEADVGVCRPARMRSEGDGCETDAECRPRLVCDLSDARDARVCRALPELGEPCGDRCAEGAFCRHTTVGRCETRACWEMPFLTAFEP